MEVVKACPGTDSAGASYESHLELWSDDKKRASWYQKAADHWCAQAATLDGVLGGFPETSEPDLRESRRFLDLIARGPKPPERSTVLDCGAGIGRVTKGLLVDQFEVVDLVEPNARLMEEAKKQVGPRGDRFITCSLEHFEPEEGRYDVIWAQWVLLYLTDEDLVSFLQRCKKGLRGPNGMIFVKENVIIEGQWTVDRDDNSISRTDGMYKEIFKKAGLVLQEERRQAAWPKDLVPVKMYALRKE